VPINGEEFTVRSASEMPESNHIEEIREPWIKGEIVVPKNYLGNVLELVNSTRGHQTNISYLDAESALVAFKAPLANVLTDFYDKLKSVTSGYGSFSYEMDGYVAEDLVKLEILVGGESVDSLAQIIHRREALPNGRQVLEKLQELIPRQLFEVTLQAAISGKIIARENIKPLGKNVTAKLYGGDVSRKKKLWAKQKAGKARMKSVGKVDIPPEAFAVLLRRD
jgi:GTP-binding protein LepA